MEENSIKVIIVNPRNDRLYNYWINGSTEKRCMLKERMREFCLDLCPSKARNIDKCINEIIPFVIFVDTKEFKELEENPPAPIPKCDRIFPLRKKVYSKKGLTIKRPKSEIEMQSSRFNIWEKYQIHLSNKEKQSESIFKSRIL